MTPEDGAYQDFFGMAVDIDGDTCAAGSPDHLGVGAVYVFERDQGGMDAWGQSAELLVSDGASGDSFGQDVLVDQDLLFAGATGRQESAGAVYIYGRDPGGSGSWDDVFQLTADEPVPGEGLGNPLAADGLTLLAGAVGAELGGAVYVYTAYSPPTQVNLTLAPNPLPEGTQGALSGSFSDPDPDESHALNMQWGDGSITTMTLLLRTQAFTVTHTYLDDLPSGTPADPYTLTVTITDTHGGTAWAQLPVVVENVPPSVLAGADAYLRPGESLQRWGSFTDPGTDTWTGSVDYGDGGGVLPLDLVGQTFWLDHTYPSTGIYWVTVTVTDDDGGQAAARFMVRVSEQPYWVYLNLVQKIGGD